MATRTRPTPAGETLTRIVLATFRANGLLLSAGDDIAGHEGLTASRWQVLGALVLAERPLTVPQIARRMGLARQSVHATVRTLVDDDQLTLDVNADHARSQLVRLTDRGAAAYEALAKRQTEWVNDLADGLDPDELDAAAGMLEALCERLDSSSA
ncbi:MAG: MarR family transcriptional regulator [Candidatus Nanopelagicales bacterium]